MTQLYCDNQSTDGVDDAGNVYKSGHRLFCYTDHRRNVSADT